MNVAVTRKLASKLPDYDDCLILRKMVHAEKETTDWTLMAYEVLLDWVEKSSSQQAHSLDLLQALKETSHFAWKESKAALTSGEDLSTVKVNFSKNL